jgi:hypothetical protein
MAAEMLDEIAIGTATEAAETTVLCNPLASKAQALEREEVEEDELEDVQLIELVDDDKLSAAASPACASPSTHMKNLRFCQILFMLDLQ